MEENYEQIFEELINKHPIDTLYAMFHYIDYYPNGYEILYVGDERAGFGKKGTYLFKRNSENKKILLKFLPEETNQINKL